MSALALGFEVCESTLVLCRSHRWAFTVTFRSGWDTVDDFIAFISGSGRVEENGPWGLVVEEADDEWCWGQLDVDLESRTDLIEELLHLVDR